jgi:hypothetical protein
MQLKSILSLLTVSLTTLAVSVSAAPAAKTCASTPKLTRIGGYETGLTSVGASEIVSYDPKRQTMLITNAVANVVDVSTNAFLTLLQKSLLCLSLFRCLYSVSLLLFASGSDLDVDEGLMLHHTNDDVFRACVFLFCFS